MIHYPEIPFDISEIELEADVKETLLFFFNEHVVDGEPWDPEEIQEQAQVMIEERLGRAVEATDPLVKRVEKELTTRMDAARADYQYRIGKIKEEI